MPNRLYPLLLTPAFLITFVAGGHGAAFLIETLCYPDGSNHFWLTNFLHTLFFLSIGFCFFQRRILPFFLYFLISLMTGLASTYSFGQLYESMLISQIPFLLIGLHGCYAALREIGSDRVKLQWSVDDLLKAIVFAGLAAIAFKFWYQG